MAFSFKSLFADVEKAEHSTVAWIEKELARVAQEAPTIEHVVDAGIGYVAPVLELIATSVGQEPLAAEIAAVAKEAQADLTAASALITDFGPTPTFASIFQSVEANLSALLTAGHVKSTNTIAQINKVVTEVGLIGSAVSIAAAGLASTTATTPAPAVK